MDAVNWWEYPMVFLSCFRRTGCFSSSLMIPTPLKYQHYIPVLFNTFLPGFILFFTDFFSSSFSGTFWG